MIYKVKDNKIEYA